MRIRTTVEYIDYEKHHKEIKSHTIAIEFTYVRINDLHVHSTEKVFIYQRKQ